MKSDAGSGCAPRRGVWICWTLLIQSFRRKRTTLWESDIHSETGFDSRVDAVDGALASSQIDEMVAAPGLSFLTRCGTRRVRAVSKTHARSLLQARLFEFVPCN